MNFSETTLFIIGIVTILFILIWLLGLVLSIVGLTRKPRTLAVCGLVFSVLTGLMIAFLYFSQPVFYYW